MNNKAANLTKEKLRMKNKARAFLKIEKVSFRDVSGKTEDERKDDVKVEFDKLEK